MPEFVRLRMSQIPDNEFSHDLERMPSMDAAYGNALKLDSVLLQAHKLIHGDRQKAYGHPLDNFTLTGILWGAWLGLPPLPPEDVAIMKVLMKIAREKNLHNIENIRDGAGYLATIPMIREERDKRAESSIEETR